ncbi:hypothetical protein [Kaarinaea lacus]
MISKNRFRVLFLLILFVQFFSITAIAENGLKPYILADTTSGDLTSLTQQTKDKLSDAGFELVGEYTPYANTIIIIVTNDSLKANAAASEFGAFGAIQRVTLTQVNEQIQIAFTNPVYMANAYRMKSDLSDVSQQLKQALGDKGEYGPDKTLTAEDLRKYHYKWLMPYFTDRTELGSFDSHEAAIKHVEETLQGDNKGGVKKVYRVDIPNKQQTVIGVSLAGPENVECSGDKYIMEKIDFKEIKSTGHLPYEIVISENTVYMLPAKFRIAISFPDLSMMGSNSFASIMCAPGEIEEALKLGTIGK